jgi:hypothetical protein
MLLKHNHLPIGLHDNGRGYPWAGPGRTESYPDIGSKQRAGPRTERAGPECGTFVQCFLNGRSDPDDGRAGPGRPILSSSPDRRVWEADKILEDEKQS